MKKCRTCKNKFSLNEFYENSTYVDGYTLDCKTCFRKITQANKRTKVGVVSKIYYTQVRKSKLRNHLKPNYSKDELIEWVLKQENFEKIYHNWVSSGYDTKLVPSIDRLDNEKSYCINNIQIVTWCENDKNGHDERRNGVYKTKQCISVEKLDIDGVIIEEYISLNLAARENDTTRDKISRACASLTIESGFMWRRCE